MKSALYCLLLFTTTARLIDVIYLLTRDSTNLPVTVFVVSAAMVVYGMFLIGKRFFGNVTLRQLILYYMAQTLMIAFNIVYVAIACPLKISVAETLMVGTFLDILINCVVIYFGTKRIRSHYFEVTGFGVPAGRHV